MLLGLEGTYSTSGTSYLFLNFNIPLANMLGSGYSLVIYITYLQCWAFTENHPLQLASFLVFTRMLRARQAIGCWGNYVLNCLPGVSSMTSLPSSAQTAV